MFIASVPDRDTIFALSSGRPPAAIAVIRLAGPHTRAAIEKLIGRVPEPRRASLARLRDPATAEVLDEGLVLWFPGPRTELGEDMAEFHLHGGRAVIAAVLAGLGRLEGLRPADPGEFTRRGFENGKLDLTAVEGLADLIFADTEAQRRQALRQLGGALGVRAEAWRGQLIEALAAVEAGIDFSDEGDVPDDLLVRATEVAARLRDEIRRALADGRRGERLRDGLAIAIVGPPNAGKSSLLNRIAQREAAIVSPLPGTTRDVIEVHLDLAGYPVMLIDTAGLRETADPVESEGVRRALDRAAQADLVLYVVDGTEKAPELPGEPDRTWLVRNKIDLLASPAVGELEARVFALSAKTGAGLDDLLTALERYAGDVFVGPDETLITRERHRNALDETVAALERALAEARSAPGREDLVAEELRLAARWLGRLTGRVDVEHVLDAIFRDFCIGK